MQTLKTENTRKLLAECRPEIGDPQWALDAFVEITKMCDAAEQPTPASDVDCPKCKEWRDIALMQSERLADGKFTEVKVPCVDCEMRKLNPAGDVGEALEDLRMLRTFTHPSDADCVGPLIDKIAETLRLLDPSVNKKLLEFLRGVPTASYDIQCDDADTLSGLHEQAQKLLAEITAEQAALTAQSVNGMVLVPREPTEEMLDAAFKASMWPPHSIDVHNGLTANMIKEYKAMIAAAEKAQGEGENNGLV